MKAITIRVYLGVLFLFSFFNSHAQENISSSDWKGFQQLHFSIGQTEATLVVPKKALPGHPWMWRARFPNWHTEADSLLVSEGFHVAFINTNDLYGSPKAMEIWDKFYAYLLQNYQLNERVALNGVSRGGLFVYNWAKQHPDKVSCIYAEAPVCDFKSWPGGFGVGKGSEGDWAKLKLAYGFASDEEAKAYRNNPIDGLEALAAAKIPVLHMIGLEDQHVPASENTFTLVDRYVKLGGIATIVPCTQGEQSLDGHHFPIETPRLVADFIKYYATPKTTLDPSNYHAMRGGLPNAQRTFEREKKGRVAFLGGSITYNSGWRDSVCLYLQKRFPETTFEFIAAGIPSMGSTPGAFRLERDILSKGPIDLLFEEAAVNDQTNGRTDQEQIRGMEGIVRHVKKANPAAEVVLMHFVDPDKMKDYNEGRVPAVIQNHEKVAIHYNLPSINLAKEVTDRINQGEFTWKNDFKDLHPSPFGQGVYARSIIHLLETAFSNSGNRGGQLVNYPLPAPLDPQSYDSGYLIAATTINLPKGWRIDPAWKPQDQTGTRANYVNVPMLISEKAGSKLSFDFQGKAVGIAVAAGQDAGTIEYRIDKGPWQTQNLFTQWSAQLHLPWYYTLATDLTPQQHRLQIRIAEGKDERSKGHACRIRYFFVNRP
ncbi:MAG: GDSL-type esterase/lipase family protein [Saprospiraceae bacterium]